MTDLTERRLGWGFGLLGAVLIGVGGLVALIASAADLVTSRMPGAAFLGATALVLLVLAGLAFVFAYLGYHTWSDRPLVSGVLLVVIAAVAWAALGFGANVFAVIGALFVFLAGVLYIVGPAVHGAKTALSTA
jgi:hypothetical protein